MPQLRAFNGTRYSSSVPMADVVCPPYDVISAQEQAKLYARHTHNAVRVELPFSADEGQGARYGSAAEHFARWTEEGVLQRDDPASLYAYRQDFVDTNGTRQRVAGVIGALALEPLGAGGVLPHERTMPGPIEDRLALLRACPVNISPIYAIYRGDRGLAEFFEILEGRPTDARFADEHGTLHRLWVVRAPAEIALLSDAVGHNPLVIADGHHRYETALAFRDEQDGPGEHDAVMCFCVDADAEDLVVLPYHRAVRARTSPDEIERRLRDAFDARPDDDSPVESGHSFVFVLPHARVRVALTAGQVDAALPGRAEGSRRLDVVALHDVIFPAVFGDDAVEAFKFSKDANEIERVVREDGWSAGVLMQPMSAVDVVDVARAGERLPQKASYFWPKALTGLVFRSLR